MIETWVGILATGLGAFISALVTRIFTKKQYDESVEAQRVQNFDAALEAYKKMYEDMIDDLKQQVVDLKEENKELNKRLGDTTQQVITLTNFVLANALRRADGDLNMEDINKLKNIIE